VLQLLQPARDGRRRPSRAYGEIREGGPSVLTECGEQLADLAVRTGWTSATVARRLEELQHSGAIFFDVDVDPAVLGVTTSAMLCLSVPPAHVDAVGRALAEHDELAFVAATTGRTNLVAHALCASPDALHTYLTERLGALEAVTGLETLPILRTVKAAAPFA
jgi:DNA-binding Lrp family transcriptional regulator